MLSILCRSSCKVSCTERARETYREREREVVASIVQPPPRVVKKKTGGCCLCVFFDSVFLSYSVFYSLWAIVVFPTIVGFPRYIFCLNIILFFYVSCDYVHSSLVQLWPNKLVNRFLSGGEFKCDEFVKFCRERGIRREYTAPYSPEQNGIAESMNRTIQERVVSMLQHSGPSDGFWAEALLTVS